MDTTKGNFLELAFQIEHLLRLSAAALSGKDITPATLPLLVTDMLREKGLLTDEGVAQIESIRWLRNMFTHGRDSEISSSMLTLGESIASQLYEELRDWLEKNS